MSLAADWLMQILLRDMVMSACHGAIFAAAMSNTASCQDTKWSSRSLDVPLGNTACHATQSIADNRHTPDQCRSFLTLSALRCTKRFGLRCLCSFQCRPASLIRTMYKITYILSLRWINLSVFDHHNSFLSSFLLDIKTGVRQMPPSFYSIQQSTKLFIICRPTPNSP